MNEKVKKIFGQLIISVILILFLAWVGSVFVSNLIPADINLNVNAFCSPREECQDVKDLVNKRLNDHFLSENGLDNRLDNFLETSRVSLVRFHPVVTVGKPVIGYNVAWPNWEGDTQELYQGKLELKEVVCSFGGKDYRLGINETIKLDYLVDPTSSDWSQFAEFVQKGCGFDLNEFGEDKSKITPESAMIYFEKNSVVMSFRLDGMSYFWLGLLFFLSMSAFFNVTEKLWKISGKVLRIIINLEQK